MGDMRAMVFAAGLGTRLRPLTDLLPKPAVPFFDRPLAGWTLDALARAGVRQVVANTHHLAEACERELARARPAGMDLLFSREDAILGTGGGLRRAWQLAEEAHGRMADDEVLVVVNGDILFEPDLARLVRLHRERRAIATMAVRETADPWTLGAIEHGPEGLVSSMLRKAPDPSAPAGTRAAMFTGVHVLSRAALERLPAEGCIVRGGYVRWLAEGARVGAVVCEEPWRDLGTPAVYLEAHLDVLAGRLALPGVSPARAWRGTGARISPAAVLDEVVVGAGATVGAVALQRVIVWPGATVEHALSDAIVLPDGRVVQVRGA